MPSICPTSSSNSTEACGPAARTISDTCKHYGWTRSFVFLKLATGDLAARKAGRRTLITSKSAERLFGTLPPATYRALKSPAA
jgi:hypothetical protein